MRKSAAFILTHGRPGNVLTYQALRQGGYTGPIYLIVDNEDKTLDEYKKKYGSDVFVFDKKEIAKKVDSCNNFGKRNSVIFARNWNFVLAKLLGITHFVQLDDDYARFGWGADNKGEYARSPRLYTNQLDSVFNACWDFLDNTKADCLAFAQGGDFIGGAEGRFVKLAKQGQFARKIMNSFFYRTDADIEIRGMGNDDVNLYVERGRRGQLFVTIPRFRLWQQMTQKQGGGLTEMYLEMGTYIKSFYTIMVAPSCAKIVTMGTRHKRIHHAIKWGSAVPVIVDERHRKPRPSDQSAATS